MTLEFPSDDVERVIPARPWRKRDGKAASDHDGVHVHVVEEILRKKLTGT